MSITTDINKMLDHNEVYISLQLECRNNTQILSNVPDTYKNTYYQNKDELDDTFAYTRKHAGTVCFPNNLGNYSSEYTRVMASHGYHNLFSFCIESQSSSVTLIASVPWLPTNNTVHYQNYREHVVKSAKQIIKYFADEDSLSKLESIVHLPSEFE